MMKREDIFKAELKQINGEWNVNVLNRNNKIIGNTSFKTYSEANEYMDNITN